MKSVIYCCVYGCGNNQKDNSDKSFCSLPNDDPETCPFILMVLTYLKLTRSDDDGWAGYSDIHYAPYGYVSKIELQHDPHKASWAPSPEINDSGFFIPDSWDSPDYRVPEPAFAAYQDDFYREANRPYRITPLMKIKQKYDKQAPQEHMYLLGCGCCVTFKRHVPVSTGAVLTTRHILTSATAVEMVLRKHGSRPTLENILGVWYDTSGDITYNSSYYASIARIHYHPRYNWPDRTNVSHPLPCVFDLALLATTYNLRGDSSYHSEKAVFCQRGVSSSWHYSSTTLHWMDLMHIVGYQFIWYSNKVPTPFHKYLIRTRLGELNPCPKIEWGWYHCVEMREWGKLGLDLGGLDFIQNEGFDYRYSGLVGLNALSMKLRSMQLVNYFTVLDRYCVIDWLYAAYMGRQKYRWLDIRFRDTQFNAPRLKPWLWIPLEYVKGIEYGNSGKVYWAK